jgi:hypothetical protein
MRRELKAEQAKEAFDRDMSALQGAMPVIVKSKPVKDKSGNVRYRYAPIDSIIDQTKKYISKYGFSYAITTEQSEVVGEVKAICTVKHRLGHSEGSTFRVPIDKDGYMTAPQKVGAALTFAKRYAFCNAFGIITGDEDNDGSSIEDEPQKPRRTKPQPSLISKLQLETINNLVADFPEEKKLDIEKWVQEQCKPEGVRMTTEKKAEAIIEALTKKLDSLDDPDADMGKNIKEVFETEDEDLDEDLLKKMQEPL